MTPWARQARPGLHRSIGERPRNGGCAFLLDPRRSANEISVFWRPEVLASVLQLEAAPDVFRSGSRLPKLELARAARHTQQGEGQAVLLADPSGEHQLIIGAVGPTQPLAVVLPLDESFHIRAESALRLHRRLTGRAAGPMARALSLTPRHRQRLVRMVRALDGRSMGASYREIATVLFETQRLSATEWKTSSIRAQTIRLARDAESMMRGGYLRLLAAR